MSIEETVRRITDAETEAAAAVAAARAEGEELVKEAHRQAQALLAAVPGDSGGELERLRAEAGAAEAAGAAAIEAEAERRSREIRETAARNRESAVRWLREALLATGGSG